MTKIKIFSRPLLLESVLHTNIGLTMELRSPLSSSILRPSIYDLKTDEFDPSSLSTAQKTSHHQTYTKFLQHIKPKNYIFANYKYTSPYTMTSLYNIDHSRITGYLRNYDPIKNTFVCFRSRIHHVHLLYLKNTYISMNICCLATFLLKL